MNVPSPPCPCADTIALAAKRHLLCAATSSREGTKPPGTPSTAQQLETQMRSESGSHSGILPSCGLMKPLCRRVCAPPVPPPLLIPIDPLSKSMLAVPSPAPAGRRDGAAAPHCNFSIIRLLKEMPPGCTRLVRPAALPSLV